MEENLRKIAEIRDTAGLGSEGSPKGTDALDDETKLVYMEAIKEHLCYKMSTAGLRIRDKRLDETDEEYQNDKSSYLDRLAETGHKVSCGTVGAYRLLREASNLPEMKKYILQSGACETGGTGLLAPGGSSNHTEAMLWGMASALRSCKQFDGISCAARALADLIIMGKRVGDFSCYKDRKAILVFHPSLKEAFVFTASQIEDFMGNIGMLAAQDCLASVTWPYRDYNIAMHHFPALYRTAVSDLINEICACRFVVDAVLLARQHHVAWYALLATTTEDVDNLPDALLES